MKMSRGKRNVLFAGALSCAMLFGIGNTMAYFTENSVQTNVFTTGDLDIGLKELTADELTYCQTAVANWKRLQSAIMMVTNIVWCLRMRAITWH